MQKEIAFESCQHLKNLLFLAKPYQKPFFLTTFYSILLPTCGVIFLLAFPLVQLILFFQMQILLQTWPKLEPEQALELLDYTFADREVRKIAVECIEKMGFALFWLWILINDFDNFDGDDECYRYWKWQ